MCGCHKTLYMPKAYLDSNVMREINETKLTGFYSTQRHHLSFGKSQRHKALLAKEHSTDLPPYVALFLHASLCICHWSVLETELGGFLP